MISTAATTTLSRQQIQWETERRQHTGSSNPSLPQVGTRIERPPMRPGMPDPGRIGR